MIPNNSLFSSDDDFEDEIYDHLKKMGLIFPDTSEELDQFLITIDGEKVTVPADLPTGADILQMGLQELPDNLNDSTDESIEQDLAQAAREGKEISPEVLEKMKKDRQNSEKGNAD